MNILKKGELNHVMVCILWELNEEIGLVEEDIENLEFRYVTLRLQR